MVIVLSLCSLLKDKRFFNLMYRRKGVFWGFFLVFILWGGLSEEMDIENCVLWVDVLCGWYDKGFCYDKLLINIL